MLATDFCAPRPGADRFLLIHAVLIPAGIAVAAYAAHSSGLDERVATAFFDSATHSFPAHEWPALETLGHRVAKSAVVAVWLTLLSAALTAPFVQRLRRHVTLIWTTVGAMALGPTIVVILKDLNAYHCPWDLKQFGGIAEFTSGWFISSGKAGRCFPSGHAAGGFSVIALYFAGRVSGNRALRSAGLAATLAAGTIFSLVRIAQGAHFLSHNLWSAAIDWCVAALVFAPLLIANTYSKRVPPARSAPGTDSMAGLSPKTSPAGWRRLASATLYSLNGLQTTWRREAAFRQEVVAATALAPVALFAPITPYQRTALISSLVLVLIVELLNTAIEAVVDLASPQPHPLAGAAKDAGSAAVLLSMVVAAAVWIMVFWPQS